MAQFCLAVLQVQDVAIRCIQRNVRKLQAVRVWPWWRLMLRLSPLLNVHRTEEELKARTVIGPASPRLLASANSYDYEPASAVAQILIPFLFVVFLIDAGGSRESAQ